MLNIFEKDIVSEDKEKSAIQKFINLSKEEENEIHQEAEKYFQDPPKLSIEREKTEKEEIIIHDILDKLPEFLDEYNIKPLNLTPDHIHIVDEASVSPEQRKEFGWENLEGKISGVYLENKQAIVVFSLDDNLKFANLVTHEILHAHSFTSFVVKNGEFSIRRSGLNMIGKDEVNYFHQFNEAITEELSKRFSKKYLPQIPSLSEEIKNRKEFVKNIMESDDFDPDKDIGEISSVYTQKLSNGEYLTTVDEYEYQPERKELFLLIDQIYQKNKDRFESPEDIFRIFVKATFSGRLLDLARLIENNFGKGSFRELAEKFKFKEIK